MLLSPSEWVNSFEATQEFYKISWNLKVRYRVNKSPLPVPILSQISPLLIAPSCLPRYILILSNAYMLISLEASVVLSFLPVSYMHSYSHHSCYIPCQFHTTWLIIGEEYKLLSSSLSSFLQPLVTSSVLGPNILLSTLFSNTLSLSNWVTLSLGDINTGTWLSRLEESRMRYWSTVTDSARLGPESDSELYE
jgi:hypothetical protein